MFVQHYKAFRKLSASAVDDKHIIMQRVVDVTQKPRVSNFRSFTALIDSYGGYYVRKTAKPLQLQQLNSGCSNISCVPAIIWEKYKMFVMPQDTQTSQSQHKTAGIRLVLLRSLIEASQDSNWATLMDSILIWDQSWTLFHLFCGILTIWSLIRGNLIGDQISLSYFKIVVKIAAFLASGENIPLFLTAEVFYLIF